MLCPSNCLFFFASTLLWELDGRRFGPNRAGPMQQQYGPPLRPRWRKSSSFRELTSVFILHPKANPHQAEKERESQNGIFRVALALELSSRGGKVQI